MRLALVLGLWLTSAGVSMAADGEPERVLVASYLSYQAVPASGQPLGIDRVWEIASPELRRRLAANSICTVPFRKSTFRCELAVDPLINGDPGRVRLRSLERISEAGDRIVLVAHVENDSNINVVRFVFTQKSGGGRTTYALADVEGVAPIRWRLSDLVSGWIKPGDPAL